MSVTTVSVLLGSVVEMVPVPHWHSVPDGAELAGDGAEWLEPVEHRRVEVEQLTGQRRA